jgi:hypothetical protein
MQFFMEASMKITATVIGLLSLCLFACPLNTDPAPTGVVFTGVVTTPAGPAQGGNASGFADATGNDATFNTPTGFAVDGTNLYVADANNNNIRKIDLSTMAVTTFAGSILAGPGDTDATGTIARFNRPLGIVSDGTYLYVADGLNNKIRKILISSGEVTTLAGPAQGTISNGDTDSTGNSARFYRPTGIIIHDSNLYVTDMGNNKIRKIVIATRVVTTLAGPAPGSTASGDTDGTGIINVGTNLYVSEQNHKIRRIVIATGEVTTYAGPAPGSAPSGDADGTGNGARFYLPRDIASDGTNLYVADSGNHKIRKIVIATGEVTTLAGPAPGSTASGDADGSVTSARFYGPQGVILLGRYLYIADSANNKIRRLE